MITIDKGIPFPEATRNKYPFKDLQIGDSFEISCEKSAVFRNLQKIRSAANSYVKRYKLENVKFVAAETENGVRCWRTK